MQKTPLLLMMAAAVAAESIIIETTATQPLHWKQQAAVKHDLLLGLQARTSTVAGEINSMVLLKGLIRIESCTLFNLKRKQ